MGTMESWESTRSFYREKHTLRTMEAHVEPFRRAFSEIDVNDDGVITKVDLQTFVRKNRLVEDEMIESWMRLFDGGHTETITLSAYLDRLGLQEDKGDDSHHEAPRPEHKKESESNSSVRIVTVNMLPEDQAAVLQKVHDLTAFDENRAKIDESTIAKELKKWLESKYGRTWHVLIVRGSYWLQFSHEPEFSFQFELGPYVYAMWRTPVA